MSEAQEFRVFGSPGTGKTTYLTNEIQKAAQRFGAEKLFVASFTKAAAHEVAGRNKNIENVGTLHAHGYRALGGRMKVAEACVDDWNKEYPHLALSGRKNADLDDVPEQGQSTTVGDEMYNAMNMARALLTPRQLWPLQVQAFATKWERWKAANFLIDYTDMIEIPLRDVDEPPGHPSIGFFDEAQDFTPLELALVRKWGKALDYIILAGDDDQCQPAGTMVDTVRGKIPICQIKDGDMVWAYAQNDACIYKKGYPVKVASRSYYGDMYTIRAAGRTTRATDNHKWFARWDHERAKDKYCVYIMSRMIEGRECYRVGWCKIFQDKCFHLGARARLEKAEKAWMLAVTNNKAEASILESYISAKYGIPTVMFEPHGAGITRGLYTQDALGRFWCMMGKEWADGSDRARLVHQALFDYGRLYRFPIWTAGKSRKLGAVISTYETVNLFPEIMLLPIANYDHLKKVPWMRFEIAEKKPWMGRKVYSLDVEKYRSYIADGIITHNCIYEWAGARPDVLIQGEPAKKVILKQSFRVPRAVHALAQKTILQVRKREPKVYEARDADGEVRILRSVNFQTPELIVKDIEKNYADKTVMILASCSYMLQGTIKALRDAGLPFWNPYRMKAGAWNPLKRSTKDATSTIDRLLAFINQVPREYGELQEGFVHTLDARELLLWYEILKAQGNIPRGKKAELVEQLKKRASRGSHELPPELELIELENFFELGSHVWDYWGLSNKVPEAVGWLMENTPAEKSKVMEYAKAIIERRGVQTLKDNPKIIVGTIHSVKGGEADAVYVIPDLSYGAYVEKTASSDGEDAITRLKYVAYTRAREGLILLDAATNLIM
jgi:superfamily I DNA/RNA helicase